MCYGGGGISKKSSGSWNPRRRRSSHHARLARPHASYPERGWTTEPRVSAASPWVAFPRMQNPERVSEGEQETRTGLASGICNPYRVENEGSVFFPGCAERPWAVECNPYGVDFRTDALGFRDVRTRASFSQLFWRTNMFHL